MLKYLLILLTLFLFVKVDLGAAQSKTQSAEKIDYQLPYPGLLPDNPFYVLKAIRDRSIGFIISDPLKKAEFNLMQSDKRINAGAYLLQQKKGKEALAESTMSKAENYFSESIKKVKEAKKEGREIKDILRKLSLSSKKHQEILGGLGLYSLVERAVDLEKEVDDLILEE